MISLITPTGNRHLCMERCKYYIERQSFQGQMEWIICDDGEQTRDITFSSSRENLVIKKFTRPSSKNKAKSFTGNLLNCLKQCSGEIICIIEDDDWYSPDYVIKSIQRMGDYNLIIGEPKAIYYNVQQRCYRVNGNTNRASLCQTVLKSELKCKLKKYCENHRGSAFVDGRLWTHVRENGIKYALYGDERLSIGIKGLPGRKGIGIGHRPGGTYKRDANFKFLESLIGKKDAEFYKCLQY